MMVADDGKEKKQMRQILTITIISGCVIPIVVHSILSYIDDVDYYRSITVGSFAVILFVNQLREQKHARMKKWLGLVITWHCCFLASLLVLSLFGGIVLVWTEIAAGFFVSVIVTALIGLLIGRVVWN